MNTHPIKPDDAREALEQIHEITRLNTLDRDMLASNMADIQELVERALASPATPSPVSDEDAVEAER